MIDRQGNYRAHLLAGLLFALTPAFTGCAAANYGLQERFGIEKRDILVSRIESAAQAQGEAKEEFADALEAFRAVVAVDGGELETTYDRLNAAHKRAENQADEVRDRVKSVDRVARDLFLEWEAELGQYSDAGLRRASKAQLDETQLRYSDLLVKMEAATASMGPVLTIFNDRVLFLKHNLNARAIASIGAETAALEADVARLIAEMERSIAEADAFIAELKGNTA